MTLLEVTTRHVDTNLDPHMSVDVDDGFHGTGAYLTISIAEESADGSHVLTNGNLAGTKAE